MARLTIREPVGAGAKNNRDDVDTVLELLRIRQREDWYRGKLGTLVLPSPSDRAAGEKLGPLLRAFQASVQELKAPNAVLTPSGNTILYLGGVRSAGKQ